MRVVAELDAGPMLAMSRRPIGLTETSVEVERDLAEIGAAALLDVVERLSNAPVEEVPQDHDRATYAPKLEKGEGPIDWSASGRVIHNRVRGLQPWPMASTNIEGLRCLIHRTALTERASDARPGTIVEAAGDILAIAAGDGSVLQIQVIQPEGRRAMSVREFLSGRALRPGTPLGDR